MNLDVQALRRAQLFAAGAAVFAVVLGLLGLAGWLLDDRMLKSGLTGDITIKANACIALCLAALGLLLPGLDGPMFRRAARLSAAVAAALGGVTLAQHVFGWDAGIDQLLFVESPGERATMSPGRMGPPASISLLCLGVGTLLVDVRTRAGAPAQWLALAPMLLATLGVLGHLTGATQLYGVARVTGISLPMALGVLALSAALFLARPEQPPANMLCADNPGGQLARAVLPAAIVLPLALAWLRTRGEALGFYDAAFGSALILLCFIVTFTAIAWRAAVRLSRIESARALAEQASQRAEAEAQRLAHENIQTLSVLDALLAHAPLGLVFFDAARQCVRVNPYLLRVQGEAGLGLAGMDIERVLPGTSEGLKGAIERVFEASESTLDLELVGSTPEGERSWLAGIFPVEGFPGHTRLAGAFVIEITERRRLEAQRAVLLDSERAARSEAERAARLKDEFLATVSHELRTPLHAILGWVVMAQRTPALPASLERPLQIIERNARAQATLIEELLDVSRIASGKLTLQLEVVHVNRVIDAAVLAMRPALEAKQIALRTQLDPSLDRMEADPARVQQIVCNLLSNAIKFSPSGGEVSLAVERKPAHVQITVSDRGIGISSEFLPHVFDRFRQADASTTRQHGGLGLGLAIVRQLVELHGGSVHASSSGAEQGSTFVVLLPLESGSASVESDGPRRTSRSGISLQGLRVLIVDDEADARDFLARVLRDSQAVVDVVAGADEALAQLERGATVDVLVSDIGMPGKDGFALLRQVRQRFGPDRLPAIAVTAFARPEDRERALSAGFQQHLAKPVDPYELVAMVEALALARRAAAIEPRVGA